uniref:GPS domain-containing protein n=1 Tax=Panagrolaimus sp. JU765 TaxID=591449 RepID=A0AC34QT38_9BILA
MDSIVLILLLLFTGTEADRKVRHENNELYEIRIYDSAAPGTKATLNEAFDRIMKESKNCFAQLDTEVDWLEFDSDLMMFLTTKDVPSSVQLTQPATLHLMCTSNKMRSVNFSIHVTRRNRHPPKFGKEAYIFYVPANLKPGFEVGKLYIIDHDPIIYNSQINLSLLGQQEHWISNKNGSIMVKKSMQDLPLYKPVYLQALAVDYGSPQLFSLANVTIVPVSVSQPHNVRINIANNEYQIYEWDAPVAGIAEKYKVTVKRRDIIIQEMEIDGAETMSLSKNQLPTGSDYSVIITAMDVEGESPSEEHKFTIIRDDIACEGECSEGGRPMCFYGKFHKIEQYNDKVGLHCLCYNGYSGAQCDVIETCHGERSQEAFGHVDWPDVRVNKSSSIRCPYNADGTKLERRCYWDDRNGQVKWENITSSDVCKKQSSILVHLGVLANYAQRDAQTVSGINAVQRFLETILTFPAFENNKTNIQDFDSKVAEHAAQVIDTVISRNLSAVPGNVSEVRTQLDNYIHRFSKKIPVPYTLESSKDGFAIKTIEWHAGMDTYPAIVGRRCYLHLPKTFTTDVVRIICMRNTTIYPIQEGDAPVMSIESDEKSKIPIGTKALIGIRPQNHRVNYTCAYFDEKENGWSISGITVLSRNFENGFVLCETTHLSLFTLLPEELFDRKIDLLLTISNILPIITTFISIIVAFLLLLLVVCPRSHSADATLVLFLSTVMLMHMIHLILLAIPRYISLQNYDLEIYIILEYFLLSFGILMAIINSNLDLRIAQLETEFHEPIEWKEGFSVSKVLTSIIFPIICCCCSYYFNGILFYRVTTKKPQIQPINIAFVGSFLVPFVSTVFVSILYAIHAVFIGNRGLRKTPRWADDRETILRDLTNAAGVSLLVILVLFVDAILFFTKTTITRNLIISVTQFSLCGALFIFTCYMCSVHFGHSSSSTSTGSEFVGNTLSNDKRTQDLSRDRLLDNTDKSSNVSPGNATLHGFRTITTNNGYSTQNSVNSNFSSFKPQVESIYIDEHEPMGPLVSVV